MTTADREYVEWWLDLWGDERDEALVDMAARKCSFVEVAETITGTPTQAEFDAEVDRLMSLCLQAWRAAQS